MKPSERIQQITLAHVESKKFGPSLSMATHEAARAQAVIDYLDEQHDILESSRCLESLKNRGML